MTAALLPFVRPRPSAAASRGRHPSSVPPPAPAEHDAVVLPFIRPRTSLDASRKRHPSSAPPGPGPAA
jgi:hypothetical protein